MKPEVSASGVSGFPFPTEVYDDAEALALGAAHRLIDAANASPSERVSVSLSGGSTPKRLYELLAGPLVAQVPWERLHWFFGDERLVPWTDADSNYRMVREAMLDHAPVPPANVHPIATEGHSVDSAAQLYQEELTRFYGAEVLAPDRPLFDIMLLGLGSDGHTASLFPGKPALEQRRAWVTGVPEAGLSPFVQRVTLTFPAIASSRLALFLVSGEGKRPVLARIADGEQLPSAIAGHESGALWLLDSAAALSDRLP